MTGAFAAEVAAPVFEIGHFELRGFRQHQSLYGLCQDGEVPAAPTSTDGAEQAVRTVCGKLLLLARNGPPAMSAVWSLSGGKRTWRLRAPTSEFDPQRKLG